MSAKLTTYGSFKYYFLNQIQTKLKILKIPSNHSFETIWLSNQKIKITIQQEDSPDIIVKITFLVKNPITKAVIAPNILGSLIVIIAPKSSNKTPGNIIDGKTTDGT